MQPMTTRTASRRLAQALGLAWLASACSTVAPSIHNLRELHDGDGSLNRTGMLVGHLEYYLRYEVPLLLRRGKPFEPGEPERIDDPSGRSFEELLELATGDPSNARTRRQQIEWFAFLAVDSPWKLDRERCVIELGKLGEFLELEPEEAAAGSQPATVEAVGLGLQRILAGANAIHSQGFEVGPSELERGCAELRALRFDRRAALSALRGIGPIEDNLDRGDARYAALFELSEHVQRVLCQRALEEALRDPEALVITAAIRASTRVFGEQVLLQFTLQLLEGRAQFDDAILLELLTLLRERGLPDPPSADPALAELRRETFRFSALEFLVETSSEHPSGRVRLAAQRALAELSGQDFGPREELWMPWWLAERQILRARIEALGGPREAPPETPEDDVAPPAAEPRPEPPGEGGAPPPGESGVPPPGGEPGAPAEPPADEPGEPPADEPGGPPADEPAGPGAGGSAEGEAGP